MRTSHGRPWIHMTHHSPNSGEAITFLHIVFFAFAHDTYIRMVFFPETPKEESLNYPDLDSWDFGNYELLIQTSDWDEVSRKLIGLFEGFPTVLHSTCTHWGRVDSRHLVVENQTANLTLGPSFVHDLCHKCLNGSCKAFFDIYTSRPFQRYK